MESAQSEELCRERVKLVGNLSWPQLAVFRLHDSSVQFLLLSQRNRIYFTTWSHSDVTCPLPVQILLPSATSKAHCCFCHAMPSDLCDAQVQIDALQAALSNLKDHYAITKAAFETAQVRTAPHCFCTVTTNIWIMWRPTCEESQSVLIFLKGKHYTSAVAFRIPYGYETIWPQLDL